MNAQQLIETLGIDRRQLDEWLRRGMPCSAKGRRREFDPPAIEAWLIENGVAERAEFAPTIAEVAKALGVHPRTVATWLRRGAPAPTAAGYDLQAIAAWRGHGTGLRMSHSRTNPGRDAIDADVVHGTWNIISRHLLNASEALGQKFGPEAQAVLTEAMRDAMVEASATFDVGLEQT